MARRSELIRLADELKTCGNTLINIADCLSKLDEPKDNAKETEPKAEIKPEEAAPNEGSVETVEAHADTVEKPIALEEVRAIFAKISRAGYTAEIKALIKKYGADKLSDVKPTEYKAMLKDAEVIGNAE